MTIEDEVSMDEVKPLKASRIVFWWIVAVILGWLAEELLVQLVPEVDRTVSLALGLSLVATGQSYVLRRWLPAGGMWVFATTIGGMMGFFIGLQIAASNGLRSNEYLSTLAWWASIGAGVGVAQAWLLGRLELSRLFWVAVNVVALAAGGGLAQLSRAFLPVGYLQPLILGLISGSISGLMLACMLRRAGYEV
jgi:hypothetical protein